METVSNDIIFNHNRSRRAALDWSNNYAFASGRVRNVTSTRGLHGGTRGNQPLSLRRRSTCTFVSEQTVDIHCFPNPITAHPTLRGTINIACRGDAHAISTLTSTPRMNEDSISLRTPINWRNCSEKQNTTQSAKFYRTTELLWHEGKRR